MLIRKWFDMKHKLIIFDLDGTLADTSGGLISCHKYANMMMGRPEYDEATIRAYMGGPLLETYQKKFKYSDEDAIKAVKIYRERYAEVGFKDAVLYPGMEKVLKELKARKYLLAVATMKKEGFAIPLLDMLGVGKFFDLIHGVDDKDTLTKSALIDMCISELGCDREASVLVGDTMHDAIGAEKSGIDFIAALYGFGFKKEAGAEAYHPIAEIKYPIDLLDIFA